MEKYLLLPRLLFFVSLSILLLALNPVSTQDASLYQGDVDAVNIIAHRLRLNWESDEREFSSKGCNSSTKVRCDCSFQKNTVCRVTEINFSDQHLKGEIPPEIGNLTYLKSLDLSTNKIHGHIPNSLRNLMYLYFIDFSSNNMEGPIPNFFGEMSSLAVIQLAQNWLNGSIPAELGKLPSLEILDFGENQLSGPIPDAIGNISRLESIRLSDNLFTGELPLSLGNLKNLYLLVLADNNFRGELPDSFGNLTKLTIFNVRANEFIGHIPTFIGNWKQLETLVLMGNSFEGPIPNGISSLVNLTELHVADLHENHREGGFSFPEFTELTSLEYLVLRNCSITGLIPESIGQLPKLSHLDLSFNKLTGEIPTFNNYKNLTDIYLKGNKLTGLLPTWLADITVANVDFSENNFTDVPVPLSNKFKNMNSFACCSPTSNLTYPWQRNDFRCDQSQPKNDRFFINSGGEKITIKKDTYERDNLSEGASTFYINDNRNWGYSSMGVYDPTQKFMNYTVDTPCGVPITEGLLYRTARVSPVSLKYYGFCMKNGDYRITLHFSEIIEKEEADHRSRGKRLFDVIIQDKKVLTDFNIKNAARGLDLNVSQTFDAVVSDNRLVIHFYWSGKGSKRGIFELYGPLVSAISVSPVPKPGKPWRKLSGLAIAGIAGSAILLPLLILLVLWKMGCLGGKEAQSQERKDLESLPGGFFSFRQIKAATQNFSPENKIGEGGFGSVYKGVLSNGTEVAVKQLSAKSKQGSREFVNEVGVISALQHPNLVKLVGCCIDESQLLLVYEYMANNSLAHVLFGPEELRLQLKWSTRVKICHGIAKGLTFLHEESKLKIVHRDIKTTNILLDKDFSAKISDFGFAKLYEEEKTHVITRIAGTTGYMAPEYAMRGHLTSKADVYSFGVVMLEIVSGQNSSSYRPNDESVYLLDLAYVLQEKGDLLALVDPALGSDYSLKEAKTMLELAMLCTNPSPTLRPNMSEVAKILQGKSQLLNSTPIHAPYSADGFARAKIIASRSFSLNSGSYHLNSGSYPVTPRECSKEVEVLNISVGYPLETTDENGSSPNMAPELVIDT